MVNIRVASWNVQNFGSTKLSVGSYAILGVIKQFVVNRNVQVLGIMELQGGQGALIGRDLTIRLNNSRPANATYEWQYALSSRQDGGTQEEYLYLWREEQDVLALDRGANPEQRGFPAPASLLGVFDDSIIADIAPTPQNRTDLNTALINSGYLQHGIYMSGKSRWETVQLRVVPSKWQELEAAGAMRTVTFQGHLTPFVAGLTAAQRQAIAQRLYLVDILKFTRYGDRSPYVINFIVGPANAQKNVMIGLVHELGPQDPFRLDAINITAMSLVLAPAAANRGVLLMGDFNIDVGEMFANARQYARGLNGNLFGLWPVTPAQYQRVFAPILAWNPLHKDLLGASATSLTTSYLAANAPAADALSSPYDKFIFFNGPNANYVTAANSAVANLVSESISPAANTPEHTLAALIYGYDKAGRTAQALKDEDYLAAKIIKADQKITRYTKFLHFAQSKLTPTTPTNSPLRKRAVRYLKAVKGFKRIASNYRAQVANIATIRTAFGQATVTVPNGTGVALATYRGVSDHLPIVTDLVA